MTSDCGRCGRPTIGRLCPRCQRLTRRHAAAARGDTDDNQSDRSTREPIDADDTVRELNTLARAHEHIDWEAVPSICHPNPHAAGKRRRQPTIGSSPVYAAIPAVSHQRTEQLDGHSTPSTRDRSPHPHSTGVSERPGTDTFC